LRKGGEDVSSLGEKRGKETVSAFYYQLRRAMPILGKGGALIYEEKRKRRA